MTWKTFFRVPITRIAAEFAAVCVAVFVVTRLTGLTITRQLTPGPPGAVSRVEEVADLSPQEQAVLGHSPPPSAASLPFDKQILSALEQLPKTLLLEETRGPNDVALYKKAAPATVLLVTDKSLGSGVVVDPAGHIVTNAHVVEDANKIAVVFKPEHGVSIEEEPAYAATLLKVDQIADLALLKVATPTRGTIPWLPVADIGRIEVGQDVHAIGHPEGEVWTYTTGVISQIRPNYQWKGSDNLLHQGTVIQTQTAINPGNSGGPLLDDQGEIIGINSFRREGEEGLNYAVAADEVSNFLKRATSRVAPVTSPSSPSAYRVERFGHGIAGAYVQSTVPPPDMWLIYRDAQARTLKYAVVGRNEKNTLDTVIESKAATTVFYFDVDCDGIVDLIGYADAGADTVTRYVKPEHPPKLSSMIGELIAALAKGTIPYRQVHVCQK